MIKENKSKTAFSYAVREITQYGQQKGILTSERPKRDWRILKDLYLSFWSALSFVYCSWNLCKWQQNAVFAVCLFLVFINTNEWDDIYKNKECWWYTHMLRTMLYSFEWAGSLKWFLWLFKMSFNIQHRSHNLYLSPKMTLKSSIQQVEWKI